MTQPSGGQQFHISVGGNVGGAIVAGNNNNVVGGDNTVNSNNVSGNNNVTGSGNVIGDNNAVGQNASVTVNDLARFRAAVDAVKQQMPTPEAAAQVEALHAAATAPVPDVSTMARVRRWFTTNLPTLAGTVTGLLVHPVVGALVKAAGDAVVEQFKREIPGAE